MTANRFTINAFLIHRAAASEVGQFREDLEVLEDWDFNLRFLLRFEAIVVKHVLARWHWRIEATSPDDTNTVRDPRRIHEAWRARLIDEAIRGTWLGGQPHLSVLMALGARLEDLQRQVKAVGTDQDLRAQLEARVADRAVCQRIMDEQAATITDLWAQLAAIQQSASWRLTALLRKLRSLLR